uniref:NR LBD domain-containing protein n=1 Tax=Caenorhabditis tropicalis TaxID=1561998 RepID=A0A1I7TY59_9PELO
MIRKPNSAQRYTTCTLIRTDVLTCDACKMFFRRVVTENLIYECKFKNTCFLGYSDASLIFPKCKACRFRRCKEFGMNYVIREKKKQIVELRITKEDLAPATIGLLLYQDSQRAKTLASCFTITNPSLEEMVKGIELKVYVKTQKDHLCPQDWSFFALYTTVDFFLNLDFMRDLLPTEKVILLRHSAAKCSLFSGAMRAYREKRDRMVTIDGNDIYPNEMRNMLGFERGADEFLNRIRSSVVSRLIQLNLTIEEFVLITVIVFCNPGPFYDPQDSSDKDKDDKEKAPTRDYSFARKIVSDQQQKYSAALFQYCSLTYQKNGPARFAELLAIFPLIQKNFEDLQYLTTVFRFIIKDMPMKFKKIVEELI